MEEFDVAHADGAHRIAVVGQLQMEEGRLRAGLRVSLLPILHRHLESHLDRRGAVVGIEDARKALRRNADELPCKPNGGGVGKTEQGRMGDLSQLRGQRSIEAGMPMTMKIDPNRRRAVQIFSPLRVDQVGAASPFDDDRQVPFPFLHLREGMPEIRMVPGSELSRPA